MNNECIKTVEEIEEMIRNDFYGLFYEAVKQNIGGNEND